jgi:ribosomal protein bL25 (Ctc-form)
MNLNDFDTHSIKVKRFERITESRFGKKIDFSKLTVNKAIKLTNKLEETLNKVRHSSNYQNAHKDPRYSETLLVKEVQYDHFGKYIIHADFMRVDLAELVRVTVEVAFKGSAPGSEAGGMLDHHLDQLEIECKVSEIPESLECSINEMEIGGSIHARDVVLPAGAKLITDPGALLLTCHLVAEVKSTEEVEGEMPTAPEVITEKAPEEGEDK